MAKLAIISLFFVTLIFLTSANSYGDLGSSYGYQTPSHVGSYRDVDINFEIPSNDAYNSPLSSYGASANYGAGHNPGVFSTLKYAPNYNPNSYVGPYSSFVHNPLLGPNYGGAGYNLNNNPNVYFPSNLLDRSVGGYSSPLLSPSYSPVGASLDNGPQLNLAGASYGQTNGYPNPIANLNNPYLVPDPYAGNVNLAGYPNPAATGFNVVSGATNYAGQQGYENNPITDTSSAKYNTYNSKYNPGVYPKNPPVYVPTLCSDLG